LGNGGTEHQRKEEKKVKKTAFIPPQKAAVVQQWKRSVQQKLRQKGKIKVLHPHRRFKRQKGREKTQKQGRVNSAGGDRDTDASLCQERLTAKKHYDRAKKNAL